MDDEVHADGRIEVDEAIDEDSESHDQDEKQAMLQNGRRNSSPGIHPSPMASANIFSKYVSFWWLNPLLSLGSKRTLVAEDFYGLTSDNTTEVVGDHLQSAWDDEVYEAELHGRKPRLTKAIFHTFGWSYISLGFFALLTDALRIIQPVLLGYLVSYFSADSTMSMRDAFLYALGVSLCSVVGSFFMTPFVFLRSLYGMRLRVACTALVYNKVLKLGMTGLAKTTTGNIVNLISSDTQRFDLTCYFLHYIVLGPLEALVVLVLLWMQIGPSSLAGMGLLFLLVPLQIKMGDVLMYFRRQTAKWVDDRVKIMNEIISGMRVIKMYTWEESFTQWLDKTRLTELGWFRKLAYVRGIFMSFFFSSSALISFVTFLTYVLLGNPLTADKVFTCTALFSSVRVVMALMFPIGITLLNEGRVSVERIQKLLTLDEMNSEGRITSSLRPKPQDCEIVADSVHASWTEGLTKPTLKSLGFSVGQRELLAVIGPVGAGKSSLLMAILGELPLSQGTISVKGKIAYASQQAWIYNGTLRQNVVFGREFDESHYDEVIKVCALEKDIELLSEGDMTLVGERGVSLSGGQKARVSLARAVYADADIYLLDDPLSAVDANVGRHLFNKCINGFLRDKPRVLVTHQLQYLKEADQLIALSEGECLGQGSYQELARSGVDFMSLLAEEDADEDSAIESDAEPRLPSLNTQLSRQFSRQDSGRPRASSYRFSQMLESTMSMTSDVTEMSIFEEDILPKETKQEGAVTKDTYLRYMREMHSGVAAGFIVFLFVITQVTFMMSDWWLSYWCNKEEEYELGRVQQPPPRNSTPGAEPGGLNTDMYLGVYATLVATLLFFTVVRTQLFFALSVIASRNLHTRMFAALIRAPSFFFDTNSIGRILNRFAKDLGFVDDMLPRTVCDFFQTTFVVLGILTLVAGNNHVAFAIVIPISILFWLLRTYYMKSSREVKRIEGISRSPLFGHFSTTLLGLDTIRAFGVEQIFAEQMHSYQDAHSRAWFTFIATSSWLGWRMDLLCVAFISFVALVSPALKDSLSAGVVGLTLSYAVMIPGVFQQAVRQSTEVENLMTSVERVLEYCDLESEAPSETDSKPPPGWPSAGRIVFDNMSFAYHRTLPRVLHKISCCIKPMEKIGVVGRTGAGKSSLLSTLFRLAEPSGLIEIDGVNIQKLGLKDLRSKLSIIPQDPMLFSGTMRRNIDPFGEHGDMELWQVLDEVQLKPAIEELPGRLDTELAEAGSNFSVGQRQLVCLARAILRHSKILVIDEATANVDPRTDALIQNKIREKFRACTVLTIAHRLHTIMDSDRVMVLDAGRLKEFDAPYTLLKSSRTLFSQLVNQTGPDESRRLYEIAKETFHKHKVIPETEEQHLQEPERQDDRTEEEAPPTEVAVVQQDSADPQAVQFETNI